MAIIRSIHRGLNRIPPNPVLFDIPAPPTVTPLAAYGARLLTIVKQPETWDQHFSARGWNTIQDQLNAGYNYFAHPAQLIGNYDEIFDFGLVISNSIVSVNVSRADIVGEVDYNIMMAASLDNLNFPALISGSSLYATNFRYVYVQLNFTESPAGSFGGIDLTVFTKLTVSISVKEQVDSGSFFANAGHVKPGTSVNFNKTFKDVNSLTATVESPNEPYEVVISWVDAPYPTSFSVMVFDTAGNRVSKQVSWKARGVT